MFSLPTFIFYCFTSTITPGPNNLMSMSWGMRVGFFKALPFNLGVITGFFAVMLLCCIGCAALNSLIPEIMGLMKILGTLYLVWLAWKILKAVYSLKPFEIDKKKAFYLRILPSVCQLQDYGLRHRFNADLYSSAFYGSVDIGWIFFLLSRNGFRLQFNLVSFWIRLCSPLL